MQNTLAKRLAALEAAKATSMLGQGGLPELQRLMILLIAFHLGGMQEGEPIVQAMGRGLGYERAQDLPAGLEAESGTVARLVFDERYRSAVERILALQSTALGEASDGLSCALRSLFYAMPDRIQHHRFLDGMDLVEMFEGVSGA